MAAVSEDQPILGLVSPYDLGTRTFRRKPLKPQCSLTARLTRECAELHLRVSLSAFSNWSWSRIRRLRALEADVEILQGRGRGNAAAGLRYKGAHEKLRPWRVTSPGEEGSARKGISALIEDAVGELKFADIANYVVLLAESETPVPREACLPNHQWCAGHTVAYGAANAEVIVVARFVNPVD